MWILKLIRKISTLNGNKLHNLFLDKDNYQSNNRLQNITSCFYVKLANDKFVFCEIN